MGRATAPTVALAFPLLDLVAGEGAALLARAVPEAVRDFLLPRPRPPAFQLPLPRGGGRRGGLGEGGPGDERHEKDECERGDIPMGREPSTALPGWPVGCRPRDSSSENKMY